MLSVETISEFIFNHGVYASRYDKETGLHSNFGNGVYEFRVGDEVAVSGRKYVIAAIRPDREKPGCSRLEFKGGRSCLLYVAEPTNPERRKFGFIVRTSMVMENGQPTGGASRYVTREEAEAEVQRLVGINYPGAIMILDSDSDSEPAEEAIPYDPVFNPGPKVAGPRVKVPTRKMSRD